MQLATLDPGTYVATVSPVVWQGHTWSPIQATIPVTVDTGITELEIPYTLSTGALAVDVEGLPSGVQAQFSVSGPDGFSKTGSGSSEWVGLWPGTYTTTATAVVKDGKRYTPTRGSKNTDITPGLTPKRTKVTYSQSSGVLALTINGLPNGVNGQVIIIGPNSVDTLASSGTIDGLPDGSYTVVAQPIGSGAQAMTPSPTSAVISVSAGVTSTATVTYTGTTGSLQLSISGLPSGTGAAVTVAGPGGYTRCRRQQRLAHRTGARQLHGDGGDGHQWRHRLLAGTSLAGRRGDRRRDQHRDRGLHRLVDADLGFADRDRLGPAQRDLRRDRGGRSRRVQPHGDHQHDPQRAGPGELHCYRGERHCGRHQLCPEPRPREPSPSPPARPPVPASPTPVPDRALARPSTW